MARWSITRSKDASPSPPGSISGSSTPWARPINGRYIAVMGGLIAGCLALAVIAGAPHSPLVPPLPPGGHQPGWAGDLARASSLDRLAVGPLIWLSWAILALLGALFWMVVRWAWAGRVGARPVMAVSLVCTAIAVAAPLMLSRDVYSYAAYGRIVAVHGANPYVSPPSSFPKDRFVRVTSPQWRSTPSLYGPAFVLLSAGVEKAWPDSPVASILAFKVVAGSCAWGAALLAAAACRRRKPHREAFAAAAIGLNPVILVHTVGGGHNDALIAALLAGALLVGVGVVPGPGPPPAARGTPRWGPELAVTTLLTLAALVKVVVGVALVVWLWALLRAARNRRPYREVGIHAAAALALAALVFAPFMAGLRAFRGLATLAGVQGWASGARLAARGVQAVVDGLFSSHSAALDAGRAVVALFLAVFAVAWLRILRRTRLPDVPAGWGRSLLAFTLAAPYLVPWYVAWTLPFLPFLEDEVLTWMGLALSSLLALTGVPAEPGADPGIWRGMVLGVHYGAAPIALGMFAVVLFRLLQTGQGRWSPPAWRRRGRTPVAPADRGRRER